ncbi:hypothetical protein [Mammaliicoccus stepanovicii]|uniref:Uncharacterized protein n=1 Tax=Mammaliicoccus stepanovicii TaxID=643214 RepID=A0A239YWQ3_9STAP|nr:hypothetical protein [Mammaliicoccus stepanovicii]PNZ74405.1 hypothetical protein CD111_08845 [Mammaliicoccus stepanovicii]GGI40533.1 hypothetical protein GCM10010896_08850 [Mammaliicoccus stepanovicii]SNV63519.1 Uncharacterised protein [Mammaliicoccus stepanovicii]
MLQNIKIVNGKEEQEQIIYQFYKGLNHETFHDAVLSLEERTHMKFSHGEVYFQNDLNKEDSKQFSLSQSDGLFVLNDSNVQKGAIIPLQLIVQYLVSNRDSISKQNDLNLIQLENIIDRLELTLKTNEY